MPRRGIPRAGPAQWYWMRSISACGCSTRTPSANGFGSSVSPRRASSAYTSRAECPVARITPRPSIRSPPDVTTPATRPAGDEQVVDAGFEADVPPCASTVARNASTTRGRRLVPTCGCASTRMSSGAPCCTRIRSTPRHLATLGRSRVQLAVGEGAGAALAEAVVALRIDDALAVEPRDVEAPPADVAAALEHDRDEGRPRSGGAPRTGPRVRRRRRRPVPPAPRRGDRVATAARPPAARRSRRARAAPSAAAGGVRRSNGA